VNPTVCFDARTILQDECSRIGMLFILKLVREGDVHAHENVARFRLLKVVAARRVILNVADRDDRHSCRSRTAEAHSRHYVRQQRVTP